MDMIRVSSGNFTPGQKVELIISGVAKSDKDIQINSVVIGKKSKMSTQEILLNRMEQRLESMDKKMPTKETRL